MNFYKFSLMGIFSHKQSLMLVKAERYSSDQ